MALEEHSRLIRDAARTALSPLGFRQKGRSRLWIADRGYWALVVEFQPSGFSKGSYLNICASWLWHPGTNFTFNYYHRADGFISFETAEQFRPEAEKLAASAGTEAAQLSAKFGSLADIAAYLKQQIRVNRDFWTLYSAAIATALIGDEEFSLECFDEFIALEPTADWTHEIQAEAVTLRKLLADGREFPAAIQNKIAAKRTALKLPPLAV